MRILLHLARLVVGATFVFSGFVKLVDPLGSAYKFQEYFGEGVLNLEFLIPYALPFSIVLIIAETVLGVLLLIGYKPKFTAWSLMGLTLVFLFLTWYSAYYDKVTDCGCFGDAVKLTPWETFYKNVVLIVLVLFLVIKRNDINPILGSNLTKWVSFGSLVACLYITYHVLVHLPLIDFRPYAVGKNIQQGMEEIAVDGLPKVHDFSLESADEDLTEFLLNKEKVMLVISYNLEISDISGFEAIAELTQKAILSGYTVYGVSASSDEDMQKVKETYNLPFDFLFCDETTLKTIIRANPGVLTMDKGTVTGKWNWTDTEKVELN